MLPLSAPSLARSSVVLCVILGSAGVAQAEEELRISISSGASKVRLAGRGLVLFDGDVGDRVASSKDRIELEVSRDGDTLSVRGRGLEWKNEVSLRSLILEAKTAIRVDGTPFLGRVFVRPDPKRKSGLVVLNRIPLETYLLGIVGSEMPANWPIEALRAQAVAARTYAMLRRLRTRAKNDLYDLDASVLSQVYTGAERISPEVIEAVRSTRGEVLSFKHRLAESLFHSTCGGHTADAKSVFGASQPYLRERRCGYCKASKKYRWTMEMPVSEVSKRLTRAGLVKGKVRRLEKSGDDSAAKVFSGGRPTSLRATKVRAALGYSVLYSEDFSATTHAGKVAFSGKGFGHRVGMCQWGAKGLADRGTSYRAILAHYYDGAEIKRIY